MYDALTGDPHTQHTTNPVPCMVMKHSDEIFTLEAGRGLGGVSPTLLELMDISVPSAMHERSLIQKIETPDTD
jgi:2,3-bisphosphoglycerate-independent phosphoglycerate mutase